MSSVHVINLNLLNPWMPEAHISFLLLYAQVITEKQRKLIYPRSYTKPKTPSSNTVLTFQQN